MFHSTSKKNKKQKKKKWISFSVLFCIGNIVYCIKQAVTAANIQSDVIV